MKITVNKDFTPRNAEKATKEAGAIFKNYFTENDLLRMYQEETEKDVYGQIIACDVSVFPQSTLYFNYGFRVNLIVKNSVRVYELAYYIDYDGNVFTINNDPLLFTYDEYRIVTNA